MESSSVSFSCRLCARRTEFEQPPCPDDHGPECPEWYCTECGEAALVGWMVRSPEVVTRTRRVPRQRVA